MRGGRRGPGFSGDLGFSADVGSTEWGPGGPLQFNPMLNSSEIAGLKNSGYPNTGQIVPSNANMFYGGGSPFGLNALVRAEADDRFHEPASIMLDSIYRALRNPNQAGLVPVALSPVNAQPAIVFDWAGVHYAYWPYVGTIGQPIPRNPVTGLPYLCVKDSGTLESIYFSAAYLKTHPAENAVVVASDDPFAAYTVNGKLALFSPSLNHFALISTENSSAIDDPGVLSSSIARVKAAVDSLPIPAANGRPEPRHVPETLLGDTPDSQMRRIFLAFQDVGIPDVHLKSGGDPSLTFSWRGVSYLYGADQHLQVVSKVAVNN